MERLIARANIHKVAWEDQKLQVHFEDGSVTEYRDVPEGIYQGLLTASSPGTFIRHYIDEFVHEKIQDSRLSEQVKELKHYQDSSLGLWCTDKPETIPENIKHLFFQLEK